MAHTAYPTPNQSSPEHRPEKHGPIVQIRHRDEVIGKASNLASLAFANMVPPALEKHPVFFASRYQQVAGAAMNQQVGVATGPKAATHRPPVYELEKVPNPQEVAPANAAASMAQAEVDGQFAELTQNIDFARSVIRANAPTAKEIENDIEETTRQ